MISTLPSTTALFHWQPGIILLLAALFAGALPKRYNDYLVPVAGGVSLIIWWFVVPQGDSTMAKASTTISLAFVLITILTGIFSFQVTSKMEQAATLVYAGATISVLYAREYMSFFLFWELTAISSVFIVWAGRSAESYAAGIRYLAFQLVAGVLLLMGIVGLYHATSDLTIRPLSLDHWYEGCFLLGFGIKAAFPLLHMWLPDAYPRSSPTGSIALSAFTTKMAIYALLVHFSGQKALIIIGLGMAIWPMLYMSLENDLRRIIAYALQNQFGYMVVAIGLGSGLAINGAVAHAFACTLYGGLLYMGAGAILHTTGTAQLHALGGLAKQYPIVLIGILIGGFTIAAFPFLVGFAAKSLTLSALAKSDHQVAWVILVISSVAVIDALAFKVPHQLFFKAAPTPQILTTAKNMPSTMQWAILLLAGLCVLPGIFPHTFYQLLPNEKYSDYHLNTISHLITQYQLITFTFVGYLLFRWLRLYPNQYPQTLLDADFIYRRLLPNVFNNFTVANDMIKAWLADSRLAEKLQRILQRSEFVMISRHWPTGSMVIWVAVILMATLLLYFI